MKKLFCSLWVLASIIIFSCTKEISFNEGIIENRLVLNGLINPDSLITVHIGRTRSIFDQEAHTVTDANVFLYTNGQLTETLKHAGNGLYRSETTFPLADNVYTIKVELAGYPSLEATDTVPVKTFITKGIYSRGLTYDEYGDPHHDYDIVINDPPEPNFYELFFIYQQRISWQDTYKYLVLFQTDLTIADPVLRSESELDYFVITYIFSDSFFNGTAYRMSNKFNSMVAQVKSATAYVPEENSRFAVLRTTSYAYYSYRKYWIRHSNSQQIGNMIANPLSLSLVGEPVAMYSNVSGGYGVFAAYNQTSFKLSEK